MDTRLPLLLFAFLCITAFGAAEKKPSCFARDRTPFGRYFNAQECTCTEARQRALERGGPSEFVPTCKENGKFARVQTAPTAIFCVEEDFKFAGFGADCRRTIGK